jgi:O-antigen ligase
MNAVLSRVPVAAVIAGLMCSAPFLQTRHTYPITSFYSEWLAFVLGLATIVSFAVRPGTGGRVPIPRIAAFPALLTLVVVSEALMLDLTYIEPVLMAAGYLLWAAGLAIAGALLRDRLGHERAAVTIAWFIAIGAMLNALAALAQYCLAPGTPGTLVSTRLTAQVYGNLGQPNHLADQLALGLASLMMLYSLRRIRLSVATAVCAITLLGLALSGSRSAWLYLVAIAACAALAHRVGRTDDTRRTMIFALALLPAFVVANEVWTLPVFATLPGATTMGRWASAWGMPSERLALWREALTMFWASPLFGVGWGQFAWQHFSSPTSNEARLLVGLYTHAHNAVLQMLAETGMIGTAVAVSAAGFWLLNVRRLLLSAAGWWIVTLLVVIAIHSMLEYPLWNAYFLGVAALLLGMGDARSFTFHHATLRVTAIAMGIVLGIAAYTSLGDYVRLEVASAERVVEANHPTPRSLLLQPYFDLARAARLPLNSVRLHEKLALTSRVLRFQPTSAVAYRHSLFLALAGDRAHAEAALNDAINRYPDMLKSFTEQVYDAGIANHGTSGWYGDALRRRATVLSGANAG